MAKVYANLLPGGGRRAFSVMWCRPSWLDTALSFGCLLSGLWWALWVGPVSAQDWTGPRVSEVFSHNRGLFVRIVPGVPVDEVTHGGAAVQERFATAEFYRRTPDRSYQLAVEIALAKTVAPVDFYVSDRGYLAVLDNWRSLGQGVVMSLYSPEGTPIRSFELSDLFDPDQLAVLPRRVSSALRWRQGPSYVRGDESTLLVTLSSNAHFVFGMETGKFFYCEVQELQENRQTMCRNEEQPRQWLPKGSLAAFR